MSAPTIIDLRTKRGLRRAWIVVACVLVAVPAFYAILFTLYWPFTKQDVIDVLQERSLRTVTIDQFHNTYFPPGCIAEGVKFLHIKNKSRPPLITIQRLTVSTTYPAMMRFQRRLATVQVIGLYVTVPAKEPAGEPSPVMPLTYSNSKTSMPINNLYADGAILDFYRISNPKPLRVSVNKLAMHGINSTSAFTYKTQLYLSEVPGLIQSDGLFGPWNPKAPGSTIVHGSFSYDEANLAFFKQLRGMLSAQGNLAGDLARITVTGTADVANFALTGASHARHLSAGYNVGVNAIQGDVALSSVTASFDRSSLLCSGSVTSKKGEPGKDLSLDISSDHARIEDLIDLFISGKQAPMTGNLAFHAHAQEPGGRESFLQAMIVSGNFGIRRGKFNDTPTEQGLTKLSESTRKGKQEIAENPETVLSDLKGQVTARDGVAHLSHVEFLIPGAHAWLNGTYNLLNYQSDLSGVLITSGNVSATETGFKSFLLKALTPFFKHKGDAKVVPFKITGPYGHTSVSLDMDRKKK